jgi:3-deoxy-7-phosphoheptulonate synthase
MAMASIAAGADGLLVEVHPNPDRALSDGAESLTFENFSRLMERAKAVSEAMSRPLAGASASRAEA